MATGVGAAGGTGPDAATVAPSEWTSLLGEYRAARAEAQRLHEIWTAADSRADDATRHLIDPTKPKLEGDLDTSRSLADIIADGRTPEWKAVWARYEADRDAVHAQRRALTAAIVGDTKQRWNTAMNAEYNLLERVRQFPVTSLSMLCEKADMLDRIYESELEADDALALIADIRRLAAREA